MTTFSSGVYIVNYLLMVQGDLRRAVLGIFLRDVGLDVAGHPCLRLPVEHKLVPAHLLVGEGGLLYGQHLLL